MHLSLPFIGALLIGGSHARCVKITPSSTIKPATTSSVSTTPVSDLTFSTFIPVVKTTISFDDDGDDNGYSTTLPSVSASTSGAASVTTSSSSVPNAASSAPSVTGASSSPSAAVSSLPASSSPTAAQSSAASSQTSATQSSASQSSTVQASSTSSSSAAQSTASQASSSTSSTAPAATNAPLPRTYPADVVDKLRDSSISKLEDYLKKNSAGTCTLETASIRREWGDLSPTEREGYIAAIQCLQSKPAKISTSTVPGARSRYDDFIATHSLQTGSIHGTANFLSWHRYFIWSYEQALRNECGYTGAHPYWNWDRYAADPTNSPLFNGNSSSLGGGPANGCITTGPFKDAKVNIGPGASLAYNPRCIKRDISKTAASQCTASKVYNLITRSSSIGTFQDNLQANGGVHQGGHYTIGGDPGSDIYTSPGDPAFYLHHAGVDRTWWIWQLQDLSTRLSAVAGFVVGGSRNQVGALTDGVNLGINGASVALGTLLNTMGGKGGEFCYIYM